MAIKYAILGFLSREPMSGYDLKKLFADSDILYWSGNNNQIYRTLVQLHEDGMVTQETLYNNGNPPRKVYTITEEGLAALRLWLQSTPTPPQIRNQFLIQLMWADQLDPDELRTLLAEYEGELRIKLLMLQKENERGVIDRALTPHEATLRTAIWERWIDYYRSELAWVGVLHRRLGNTDTMENIDDIVIDD